AAVPRPARRPALRVRQVVGIVDRPCHGLRQSYEPATSESSPCGMFRPPPGSTSGLGAAPDRTSKIARTTGAAAEPPKPDSSRMAPTAYCGAGAGPNAANTAVSSLPSTSAV